MTPAFNKPGLDETSPSSCRPISNLTVISKLLERLVARQLLAYLDNHHLLPTTPSGFRRGFSTETATIRVLSDLPDAVDRGDTAALILLDLSAAFDTVDHEILRPHMYVRRTVSLCFGALCQLRHLRRYVTDDCVRCWWCRSSTQDSTMVTSSCSGCQLTCSDTFSLCSTLRLVWCSGFAATTPSQMLSQPFTGCVYLNG